MPTSASGEDEADQRARGRENPLSLGSRVVRFVLTACSCGLILATLLFGLFLPFWLLGEVPPPAVLVQAYQLLL